MAETTENTNEETTTPTQPSVKTFTQEDVDRIVQERLARSKKNEKKQNADPDPKEGDKPTPEISELEKLREENAKLTKQIADAEHEQTLHTLHTSIANKYGISDPSIIVGENEGRGGSIR